MVNDLISTAVAIKRTLSRSISSIALDSSTTPEDAMWKFLGNIYKKQIDIAQVQTWSSNDSLQPEFIGPLPILSDLEWDKLQSTIDDIIYILNPIDYLNILPYEVESCYFEEAGLYDRPRIGSIPDTNLYGADKSILAKNLFTDTSYAQKWCELKVPYDYSIGIITPYITVLSADNHLGYFRKTGNQYWTHIKSPNLILS